MPPRPGEFAVISSHSAVGLLVDVAETLSGGGASQFSHACICSRVDDDGTVWIVEAMPGGAVEVPWHYQDTEHLWSTDLVETVPQAGTAALKYVGWGYGWADYLLIAEHRWHLDRIATTDHVWYLPWAVDLEKRYQRTHTIICSQLVDQAELDAGVHLFNDGRPPGYVRPSDLADLLLRA